MAKRPHRKWSMKELQRPDAASFQTQPKAPLALVLDNVRSGLNVGSAFRTADAFALEKIYLCGITATPPHREILKTAIGATESMEWSYAPAATEVVQQLQAEGYQVFAVEQASERTWLQDVRVAPGQSYALVFGNEVDGVSDEVLALVDGCIEVPQFGTKHSLNIAVCLGLVVWEFFRQWKWEGVQRDKG
jgi:23S rRNA (guanosine2251-2'-O)-methyltransferase